MRLTRAVYWAKPEGIIVSRLELRSRVASAGENDETKLPMELELSNKVDISVYWLRPVGACVMRLKLASSVIKVAGNVVLVAVIDEIELCANVR